MGLIAEARAVDGALEATADVLRTGPHRIRVLRDGQPEPSPILLSIQVDLLPDPSAVACAGAREILPGEILPLPSPLPLQRFDVPCGAGQGADHVLAFELAQQAPVRLEIGGAPSGAGLALRADCATSDDELPCAFGPDPTLDAVLDSGRWFVVVVTNGDPYLELLLTVE